ncbi:MAG TPA: helix-turn-helix transcriptional regulator [Thermoanaerobaculia bacterium]|jgi:transcriptional regulator with XRE-family HTH domain|nr:helix-turn-helix transcriptional regulator [Thermoanaerobaculia bacterium]
MDMFAYLGETLRRLRKERGKTLEQVGKQARLGRGQLSRIENARQEATLSTLAKILESLGVSRREFFRRYDLVEAEALALHRPGEENPGDELPSRWPEDLRDVISRVELFLQTNFQQLRPVAQGAVELGEYVVLFRVLPKDSPEVFVARSDPPAASPESPAKGKPAGSAGAGSSRGRGRGGRKRRS